MEEEIKVSEAPAELTPEATGGESSADSRRAEIEKLVMESNDAPPEKTEDLEAGKEPKAEEKPAEVEEDPVEKIKKSVQKRIDKVVAQKKSVEEELAETKAELERLKSGQKPQEVPKDDTPPTPEQVEAYIAQMQEEGKWKEAAAATRYLVKLEKEIALKEVESAQEKTRKESEAVSNRQLQEWAELQRDYEVYTAGGAIDSKHDLTIANQNGLLYKTALALYNDKELHARKYNDSNVIQGFRRAAADAFREIHNKGLIKTPKGESQVPRTQRVALAEPGAEASEEISLPAQSLSGPDMVREEIKNREKNRYVRRIPQ